MYETPQAPVMPRCYRHPDQFAGVVCQRCDKPICPQCMHQASVGFHCPECVKQGGQKVYRGAAALAPARPIVTMVLIGVNAAVFVLGVILSKGTSFWNVGGQFEANGVLFGPYIGSEPWRLVTSGFLHAGLFHVAINMYSLWVLGRVLEPVLGRLRFGLVYGAALLAGSLGALIWSPAIPSLGASGAIFGLLGALLVVAQRNRATQAVRSLMITLGINMVITLTLSRYISVGAHVGGVLGGALCCFAMLEVQQRTKSKEAGIAAVVALGLAFAAIAYLLMQTKYGFISG